MSNTNATDSIESSQPQSWAKRTEASFDAKRRELGVKDELLDITGLTTLMLVVFGENGIRSIEDLADCATDDLHGWNEYRHGRNIRHEGILNSFRVSREDCDAMIIGARIKAGWIEGADATQPA
jgi:transcription termination/antitermination protein NusA